MLIRGSPFLTGGILEEPHKEGEAPKLKGSAFTTYAASREEVLEILEADIYTKSGVWDLSKVCNILTTYLPIYLGLRRFCLWGERLG
jgi:hypothetical protein